METDSTAFILNAAFFRFSLVASGLACVYMGYRLFVLGVMPREGSEIDARSGEIRLTMKNAAPGICFAFFGAAIMVFTIVFGGPELRTTRVEAAQGVTSEHVLRGQDQATLQLVEEGRALVASGDLDKAITVFGKALSDPSLTLKDAGEPLVGLASVYRQQQRLDEASALAYLAY